MSENNFFKSLDAGFIGIDKTSNEPFIWKCDGLSVQRRFELPVPSLPGSICRYSFSTTIGDISFSVEYRCNGRPDEIIFENSRVPSDIEAITGNFKSVREGTLLFIFDNAFSWYNPKMLSYRIELFQPAFIVADNQRCLKSKSMLYTTVEDTSIAMQRLMKAQLHSKQLHLEIPQLQDRLAQITAELVAKKSILSNAMDIAKEMTERITANEEKKSGLCIRCLNKKLLQRTLTYLGPDSSVRAVCKYWKLSLKELEPKQLIR